MYWLPWFFRIAGAIFLLVAAGALILTVLGVDIGLLRR
jgi:hypothetical protein